MRSILFICLLLLLALSQPGSSHSQELTSSEFAISDEPISNEIPATAEDEQEAPLEASYPSLLEMEDKDDSFDVEAVGLGAEYLSTLAAPPKLRLRTHEKSLPTITESVKMEEAPASPKLAALPTQTMPREVLSKRHGARLSLKRLPVKTSAVTEKRPVQTLPPLPPRKRAPQYRTQPIKQEVIQPVVSVQPMLHERILTRTIMQPTLQKQPVIQPIITQPVLTREIHEQPITQQQMKYRNIVQTRIVEQPKIHEELKTEEKTEAKQTVEAKAAPYPGMTQPPKKHH